MPQVRNETKRGVPLFRLPLVFPLSLSFSLFPPPFSLPLSPPLPLLFHLHLSPPPLSLLAAGLIPAGTPDEQLALGVLTLIPLVIAVLLRLLAVLRHLLFTFFTPRRTTTVLLGPPNAGKTTLFFALCENSSDPTTTTTTTTNPTSTSTPYHPLTLPSLAPNRCRAPLDLLDLPGDPRFAHAHVLQPALAQARRVLFVLDGTDFQPVRRRDLAERLHRVLSDPRLAGPRVPVTIVITKSDLGVRCHSVGFITKRLETELGKVVVDLLSRAEKKGKEKEKEYVPEWYLGSTLYEAGEGGRGGREGREGSSSSPLVVFDQCRCPVTVVAVGKGDVEAVRRLLG